MNIPSRFIRYVDENMAARWCLCIGAVAAIAFCVFAFGDFTKDAEPVFLRVGGLNYVIPKNYLGNAGAAFGAQDAVLLRMTYPGFKPLRRDTKKCLTGFVVDRTSLCMALQVSLLSPDHISSEEGFEKFKDKLKTRTPEQRPLGFDVYVLAAGSENDYTIYRKKVGDHMLQFDCFATSSGSGGSTCHVSERLGNRGIILYEAPLTRLNDFEDIDEGVRKRMNSFAATELQK